MLSDPLSFQLPRKFKVAFSGCCKDCAGVAVSDVGFVAQRSGDRLGFAVYVGGGMGAHSRVADLLEEFVLPEEVPLVTEAIKRVFDRHGNRKNKHKARLRFLVEQLGLERFRALYQAELAKVRNEGLSLPPVRDLPRRYRAVPESEAVPGEGFAEWRAQNVVPQKQPGYYLVHIPLLLGDLAADTMEKLADVIAVHGEGMAVATPWQNLVVRGVHANELAPLYGRLVDLGLVQTPAALVRHLVACAGASTCQLGICLSRGLAGAIIDRLRQEGLDLDGRGELHLHISGCPNSCGRHPVASLGLHGAARRVGNYLVPHYVIQLGGRMAAGQTRLAQGREAVPARAVPAFVADFLHAFQASAQYPDYEAFLEAEGQEIVHQLADRYRAVPAFEEDPTYYYDWGATAPFSLALRGPGECSAGVFDLIEVDLANAQEALREGQKLRAATLAARALLVTQGREARDEVAAFDLFTQYFLDAGLVPESFRPLIERGRRSVLEAEPEAHFCAETAEVAALLQAVQELYAHMDPSLRFQPVELPDQP